MKKNKLKKAALISQNKWIENEERLLKGNNKYKHSRIVKIFMLAAILVILVIGSCTIAKSFGYNLFSRTNDSLYISNVQDNNTKKSEISLPEEWKCCENKKTKNVIIQRYINNDKYINVTEYLTGNVNLDIEKYDLIENEENFKIYSKGEIYKVIITQGKYYIIIESNASQELIKEIVKNNLSQ